MSEAVEFSIFERLTMCDEIKKEYNEDNNANKKS